jgi:chaperonin GroES
VYSYEKLIIIEAVPKLQFLEQQPLKNAVSLETAEPVEKLTEFWNRLNSYGGNSMNITPLSDRVIVKLEEKESKTAGGIIIPDTAQEKTQQGNVMAVGPGTDKIKMTVYAGQKVMFDKYAGTQVKIDGAEHLIVKMADIIAVIE